MSDSAHNNTLHSLLRGRWQYKCSFDAGSAQGRTASVEKSRSRGLTSEALERRSLDGWLFAATWNSMTKKLARSPRASAADVKMRNHRCGGHG